MDDICDEAGLSPGAVYRYFASKDEIIRAAVSNVPDADVLGWLEDEITNFEDFRDLMSMVSGVRSKRYTEDSTFEETMRLRMAGWAEALRDEAVKAEVVRRWEHHIAVNERVIERAQNLGQVNHNLDPREVALLWQALTDGLSLLWVVDPGLNVARISAVEEALFGGSFWVGSQQKRRSK
jgi:AcrR family transcriptional regulator